MRDPEAPEPDVLEEQLPVPGDPLADEEETPVVDIPPDVPEADALEQGRQPAIPSTDHTLRLPDDPEVPEADALEQAEPFAPLEDEDEDRPFSSPGGYDE